MPRVSIGVPVYNGERYVAETLDSLLSQTYADFELIICDNASTDRTEQICRAYADRDSRIRYVRNPRNVGAVGNYKRAFELSSGEYFRWANADDLFGAQGLARCVEVLDRQPSAVLVYPRTKFIDEQGRVISEYEDNLHIQCSKASERFVQVVERLGYVNVIYGLIRADALRKTRLLRGFPQGDVALVVELSLYGMFSEIPEFLFFRRFHPGALSSRQGDVAATQEFFDPSTKGRIVLTQWRLLGSHVGSVMRAPLGLAETARLGWRLARMAVWSRDVLARELVAAIRSAIRRARLTFAG
jgi:glycosyltransferase involved in cell wall biosynthesis